MFGSSASNLLLVSINRLDKKILSLNTVSDSFSKDLASLGSV